MIVGGTSLESQRKEGFQEVGGGQWSAVSYQWSVVSGQLLVINPGDYGGSCLFVSFRDHFSVMQNSELRNPTKQHELKASTTSTNH